MSLTGCSDNGHKLLGLSWSVSSLCVPLHCSAYTSNPVPALPVFLENIGWRQLLVFPMEYAN